MRRLWTGLAIAIALATGTAGIVVIAQDGDAVAGAANAFVTATGQTCTRSSTPITYAEAEANGWLCGSLDAAYDVANATADASTVLIVGRFEWAGGNTNQTITGNRTSTNRITFDCAEGEECVFEGAITFGDSGLSGCPSCTFPNGPDYITIKNIQTSTFAEAVGAGTYQHDNNRFQLTILGGSTNIRIEDSHYGGMATFGGKNIEFVGGEWGPCKAGSLPEFGGTSNPCGARTDFACELGFPGQTAEVCQTQDVLIDGVHVTDWTYTQDCVDQGNTGPDGCHFRPLYVNGIDGLTIRNSTWSEFVFQAWTTISGSDAGATGNQDILIENNEFGNQVFYFPGSYGDGHALAIGAHCGNGSQPSTRNVTIRFNSFGNGASISVPGGEGEDGCESTDYKVYGNIVSRGGGPYCGHDDIEWAYNVYVDTTSGTCGTGDVYIGGTTMPFYSDDDKGPEPGDYALTGSAFAGDNLVPADDPNWPCPATDFDGTARPSGSGQFCDAGAHER